MLELVVKEALLEAREQSRRVPHGDAAPYQAAPPPPEEQVLRLPATAMQRLHRVTVRARSQDTWDRMRNLVAMTIVPGHYESVFSAEVVPMRHPRLVVMYHAGPRSERVAAVVGYSVRQDANGVVLYGGESAAQFAKDWALTPRRDGDGGRAFTVRGTRTLANTAAALDRAMVDTALGRLRPAERLVPPPALMSFPEDHAPRAEETRALMTEVLALFGGGPASLPDWELPNGGTVIRVKPGPVLSKIVVDCGGRHPHVIRRPPWCEYVKDVLPGEFVYGRLVRPPVIPNVTRARLVQAITPAGVDWVMRRVLAKYTEVLCLGFKRYAPGALSWTDHTRTLRVCPLKFVPSQSRRGTGAYLDFRGWFGREVSDANWPGVHREERLPRIQVVALDRPPDRHSGLVSRSPAGDWLMDLAGIPGKFEWLSRARDGGGV